MWHIYGPLTVSAKAIKNTPLPPPKYHLQIVSIFYLGKLPFQLYLTLYKLILERFLNILRILK